MTDADIVNEAKARLTELAQRALVMHRTPKTREFIIRTHNRWNHSLAHHECTHEALSESTVAAFRELDATTVKIINERGHDPDSILHWLDMYPSIVLGVHLGSKQPHLV